MHFEDHVLLAEHLFRFFIQFQKQIRPFTIITRVQPNETFKPTPHGRKHRHQNPNQNPNAKPDPVHGFSPSVFFFLYIKKEPAFFTRALAFQSSLIHFAIINAPTPINTAPTIAIIASIQILSYWIPIIATVFIAKRKSPCWARPHQLYLALLPVRHRNISLFSTSEKRHFISSE